MDSSLRIGCVLMAAGSARRFGSNKLPFAGWRDAGRTCANAIPSEEFYHVVVVTRFPEIVEMAKNRGYMVKINQEPDQGLSHTIRNGMRRFRMRTRSVPRRRSAFAAAGNHTAGACFTAQTRLYRVCRSPWPQG